MENSDYCKDIVYSFNIPCGDRDIYTSIFHIALHSERPQVKGITRLRSSMGLVNNCGYFNKNKKANCQAGFGPFHYKIDSVRCLPDGVRKDRDSCALLEIKTCDTPYKEFDYNPVTLEFEHDSHRFKNPDHVFVESPTPRYNQINKDDKYKILKVHNYIYNLFIDYFNIKMGEWELVSRERDDSDRGDSLGARRDSDDPSRLLDAIPRSGRDSGNSRFDRDDSRLDRDRGARRDLGGGRSIKRKSKRTRKSRKTKGSKKPRKSRKTRRLRKTRKLRK